MIRKIILSFLTPILLALPAVAQVFPGDVNNDGVVNNVDLLYLGQFFFMPGPPRNPAEQGIDFTEKQLAPWGINFPNTTIDIGFADCDGNGLIDYDDIFAIEFNYNMEHGTPVPTTVDPGQFGLDPPLYFDTTFLPGPIPEELVAFVPINLGTAALPVQNYSGIAFSLNYDPNVLFSLEVIEYGEPWVSPFGLVLIKKDDVAGKVDIAISNGPQSPLINVEGPLIQSILIIEEDVVGITDPDIPTDVHLSDIILLDGNLDPKPIVNDTVTIVVTDYDVTDTNNPVLENLQIYPNPAQDEIFLKSENESIVSWEINDLAGRIIKRETAIFSNSFSIETAPFSNGLYVLKIETSAGSSIQKKIIIQH